MDQNNNNTPTSPASPQQPDPSDNEHTPHQHHLVQANATLLLRTELDHLLEKFRLDTTIENAPQLATEVRLALEEEFILLISQYTHATYQQAVVMTLDDSKRLPIHLACDKNAPLSILTSLLDADEGNLSIGLADKWGDLPIHTAW